jgi:outer membrane lipoprotein-sorting protein
MNRPQPCTIRQPRPSSGNGNADGLFLRLVPFLFLVLLTLFGGVSESGAEQEGAQDAKSRAFKQIAASASTIETVSSDFTQGKYASMLKNPLLSHGRFAYERPDRLHWELIKPSPSGFTIDGDKAKRWEGDRHKTETFDPSKKPVTKAIVELVMAWVRADFQWLERRYKISVKDGTSTMLKLVPLSAQEKKYVAYLNIAFSQDWAYVASVEIHEKSGDYTRISFSNTLVNEPLPKGLFAP